MDLITKSSSEYKKMSLDETLKFLETSLDGLSTEEADNRVKKFGYNEILEIRKNSVLAFLKRYWGPMPWLLEFAMVLTIILNHYTESMIIFTLLTLNAVIGYRQSQNSQKAVELLKKKLEIEVIVLRDGKFLKKDARDLVPGDIITLKHGDLVPGDVTILKGELSVDESALTGESLPKMVHPADIVYSSSMIKGGAAKGVVINTGNNTYFGKTVELVKIAKPKSKQEELMLTIVRYMMYLGITAAVIVSSYAFYLHKDILFILSFIVVFLIGAIPVALPAVLTIVQAVGALELADKGVLVTRLDSIEDAASIDIFCFDKTGTITQNKLSIVDSKAVGKYNNEDVIRMATLASNEDGMDAIDLAILEYSKTIKSKFDDYQQVSYRPFNPASKTTEAIVSFKENNFRIIKGATQIIISMCKDLDKETLAEVNKTIDGFSQKGSRTIAVAISAGDENNDFKFVGVIAIADPPRENSKIMIAAIHDLGIKIIMLTGDSKAIAQEIAQQVGIGNRILRMGDLDGLNHDEQLKMIKESDGFAEVYPEDKYKIVKLLQDSGHLVGMTGDGVNDAPALKQAELGTAVSEATDVAKVSASIILTKPGLSEIIEALKISRKTYQRMLTWVINKITKVVEVVVLLTVGFFWLHNIVISLLGMSLLVFANDFVTMAIATDNVESTKTPNHWEIKNIMISSLILGLFFALMDLFVIFIGLKYFQLEFDKLQTLVLLILVFNTQFRILLVRERKHFWSSLPDKNLLIVNSVTILGFVLIGVYGIFIPNLLINQVVIILGIAFVFMIIIDFVKYYLFRRLDI
ncbi:plasma-membrane proton-efflux P-type ATPase [Acetobacterium woodii]|uniref:Cation transport ATPase n=1 Tax=Acetobacterium woodii (strain ATCC 29683 / DSM 1030 / JCM 2381 / KCTC 1655 / WB1) TaxID=931626 RepID=H6LHT2_ACEWD|nr:plasma-membrane proton-efflux P-type ATPase [Acetobacterium woodii]AFA47261.1 cation transport ATPase [Acetobacterium woodii DSM 1030]